MRSYVFGSGLAMCLVAGSAQSAAPTTTPTDTNPLMAPPPIALAATEGAYDVVELTTPPAVEGCGTAIAPSGKVLGWLHETNTNRYAAVMWGANGGSPQPVGNLCGTVNSSAYDFGANEQPVVLCGNNTSVIGTTHVYNALVLGANGAKYVGITTVYQSGVPMLSPWTSGPGAPASLTSPPPTTVSGAWDVNKNGQAVGIAGNPGDTGPARAVSWTSAGVPTLLPGRNPNNFARAFAVNDAGVIVGRVGAGKAPDEHAAMWQNGALTELGSFGGRSGASDINASNVVVGWSYDTTGDLHGFIYKGGKLTDLNLLIDRPLTKTAKGNWVVAAEWVIHEATAINDAGVIVGRGTKDGRARAIMLKPRAGGNVVSSAELQKLIAALKPTRALAQGKDVIVPATTPDADRKTAPASSAR